MNLVNKLKEIVLKGFKYGKIFGIIWLLGLLIIFPILLLYGGWSVALAYLTCKITGMCPI